MKLLLISNSTNPGEQYLGYSKQMIGEFLGKKHIKALFIPYAAVTFSYDDYELKVRERFREVGHDVISIHHFSDPAEAVRKAQAIVVGGGNTWMLLKLIRDNKLVGPVREKVLSGTPYIGWSAGSNVACPTIRTTNDMPVIRPSSFGAFNLIPFQINPHYLDAHPSGHGGETRQQRIEEFLVVNQEVPVVGLREASLLWVENETIKLMGSKPLRLFRFGKEPQEFALGSDLSFLCE